MHDASVPAVVPSIHSSVKRMRCTCMETQRMIEAVQAVAAPRSSCVLTTTSTAGGERRHCRGRLRLAPRATLLPRCVFTQTHGKLGTGYAY